MSTILTLAAMKYFVVGTVASMAIIVFVYNWVVS